MAEYIDREALLNHIRDVYCADCNSYNGVRCRACSTGDAIDMIEDAPAADVALVVHGRWEFLGPNRLIKECMCGTCSVCKVRSKYIVNTVLCPKCGAEMDGGADYEAD